MLAIIDYGVGNLRSIQNMLKKAGITSSITGNKNDIINAQKLLLPGMGHFDHCMNRFNNSGLRSIVEDKVLKEKTPVLGICVGLQMLMQGSEEGTIQGLGWLKGETVRFRSEQMKGAQKIPNMGWIDTIPAKKSPLLNSLENARFYFAHSYHVLPDQKEDELITAEYGYSFCAGIEKENILGVQFHPEKSHRFGMQLLKNFGTGY